MRGLLDFVAFVLFVLVLAFAMSKPAGRRNMIRSTHRFVSEVQRQWNDTTAAAR